MTRILLLKGAKSNKDSEAYELTQLLSEHTKSDVELVSYFELTFIISDDEQDIIMPSGDSIASYDVVYLRDFQNCEYERNACALFLQAKNIPFRDNDVINHQHISKLTQYFALAQSGVPIPYSIFGCLSVVEGEIKKAFGFPFIAKSITGKNGGDNFLIRNPEQLEEKKDIINSDKFVFQEFIENDRDYRVVVIGNQVGGVYERKRLAESDSHVNNVAAGGAISVSTDHGDLVESTALRAAKAAGREITGVDVMASLDSSRTLVLEVNANYAVKGSRNTDSTDIILLAKYLDGVAGVTEQ